MYKRSIVKSGNHYALNHFFTFDGAYVTYTQNFFANAISHVYNDVETLVPILHQAILQRYTRKCDA